MKDSIIMLLCKIIIIMIVIIIKKAAQIKIMQKVKNYNSSLFKINKIINKITSWISIICVELIKKIIYSKKDNKKKKI